MRRTLLSLLLLLLPHVLNAEGNGATGRAGGDGAGAFDYYVMALSWSPGYCATSDNPEQCAPARRLGWILHGLWPQHETGYPRDCRSAEAPPSRRQTAAMADIMGTGGLAWHEWQAHGTCSGLPAADYFALSRRAYDSVTRPPVLRALTEDIRLPARVIEEAFLEANPALSAEGVTVTCRDNRIREVRICLTKDLQPRACGADVARDCTAGSALFDAIGG
ncbi:ribonuclease T2 family protein [Oceanicola sp. S124]|uniref:ribonuclease T2 family protein n=1 Tax=Oceanicola sp. S124 TaxID=1042378 RepID=UPI0002557979|nr:ribonuclease T2 [Oceanicola sp. S124]